MNPPHPTVRPSRMLGVALALGAFSYLLAHPPALDGADESYALYEAKRFWEGDAPYRDFFDFITPGIFYYYALAYAVAGPTIVAAQVATALLNTASCVLIFVLARHVASAPLSALAAAAFVAGMVPVWNHSGHHWLATALSLATAATVLADRWRDSSRARPLLAGALAGALLCSHQGRGTWVALWLALVTALLAWARSSERWRRRFVREACWTALGAAAVATPLLGWMVWRASLQEVVYATYTFVTESYAGEHVGAMPWAGVFDFKGAEPPTTTWLWLMKAFPALLGLAGLALGAVVFREGVRAHVVHAALLLLAVFTACSVFYFPDYIHVATIAPFPLVILAGLAQQVGGVLVAVGHPAEAVTVFWRLAQAAVAAAVLLKGAGNLVDARERHPVRAPSAFGTLATNERNARVLRELQEWFAAHQRGRPRLFAYPADAWLYLALPADNPTPFCLLLKGYNTPKQFETAIALLRAEPTAFVSLSWLMLRPGDPINAFLDAEYERLGGFGEPQGPYALQQTYLYARRDRPSDGQP